MAGSAYINDPSEAQKTFEERVAELFDSGKVSDAGYEAAKDCSATALETAQAGQSYWDYAVSFAEYPISTIASLNDADENRKASIMYWQYLNQHRSDFSTPAPNDEILIGNIVSGVLTELGFVTENEKEVQIGNQVADKVVQTAKNASDTLGKIGDKASSGLDSLATDQTPIDVAIAGIVTAAVTYPLGLAIAAPVTGVAIIAAFGYGKYQAWKNAQKP